MVESSEAQYMVNRPKHAEARHGNVESSEARHRNVESSEARHRTVESCLKTYYMVASSEVRHRTVESFRSRFSVGEVDARTRTLEDERRRTMVVQRGSTDARIHVWGFKPFPQDVSRFKVDVWTLVDGTNGTNGTNGALEQLTDWWLQKLSSAALFAVITF